jgi:5-methyltetrahydropteroyltriglutamate--homocysteine methyltransferase
VELTRAASRGRISEEELDVAFTQETRELATLQKEAGVDLLVDGQLNWKDLFRPFCDLLTGIRLGGLTRWFDNNTFYRKPIVSEKVGFGKGDLSAYFKGGLLPNGARRKAILPGPYTFAVLSQNASYSSLQDLVDDLAHSLASIVVELKKSGYVYFQFNEPCICSDERSKNDAQLIRQAYGILTKGAGAETALQTYFGDASRAIDLILDLPVDSIGIDFYETSIESLVEHSFNKKIGCGCIDGRNSLLESPATLKNLIEKVSGDLSPPAIYVTPNCDLEFLPHSIAVKKLHLLELAKELA